MTLSRRPFTASVTFPPRDVDRLTATEVIDGIRYRVVLERDRAGYYHEISQTPLELVAEPVGAGRGACL